MTDQPNIAIIMGKSGSGKSTALKEVFLQNWELTLIEPTIEQILTGSHIPEDSTAFDASDGIAIDEVGRFDEITCEKLRTLECLARKQGKKIVILTQDRRGVNTAGFSSPVFIELDRPDAPVRLTHEGQEVIIGRDGVRTFLSETFNKGAK